MAGRTKAETTTSSSQPIRLAQWVGDVRELVKFRLTLTVVFSSVMAYLIALGGGTVEWWPLFVLAMGGFLTTGAANILNQTLEKDYDRLMRRTQHRPLVTGRMRTSDAVLLAGFMSLTGISLLALFNPWTAFFGMFALVSYAFIYTPMKRVSPDAVTIGAIPGALPTLIGAAAAQGELTWLGIALFAIQFFWQFPHFYAIAFLGHEDYSRAGYRLVPTDEMGRPRFDVLGRGALFASLLLLPLAAWPMWLGHSGGIATVLAVLVGVGFVYMAVQFYRQPERRTALGMMFYSFAYIPLVLTILWLDQIW